MRARCPNVFAMRMASEKSGRRSNAGRGTRRRFGQITEEFDGQVVHAFTAVRENQHSQSALFGEAEEAAESSSAAVVPDHGLLEPLALGADPVHAEGGPVILR